MKTFKWLINVRLKYSNLQTQSSGFTLIELLVAMIIAVLVITPLLGFMINILNTDRQEQVKVTSEQEIQTAIDYITRDLQQALYAYDAKGVDAIKSQLPTVTSGTPILVFWKREFREEGLALQDKDSNNFKDDSFVYSLVAYYLIQDGKEPWSKAARIARFQIKDGVLAAKNGASKTCTDFTDKYSDCPDVGYKFVNLLQKGKTLQEKMNSWTNGGYTDNTPKPVVLVDFVDQTATTVGAPAANCPADSASGVKPEIKWSQIPASPQMTGFYVCVDSLAGDNRSVIEVYLRGNALARLNSNGSNINYSQNQASYFPTTSARIQGRSFIFSK
jgi:prepilin-type N-terminal cleavage/methylation domain-containing protein